MRARERSQRSLLMAKNAFRKVSRLIPVEFELEVIVFDVVSEELFERILKVFLESSCSKTKSKWDNSMKPVEFGSKKAKISFTSWSLACFLEAFEVADDVLVLLVLELLGVLVGLSKRKAAMRSSEFRWGKTFRAQEDNFAVLIEALGPFNCLECWRKFLRVARIHWLYIDLKTRSW